MQSQIDTTQRRSFLNRLMLAGGTVLVVGIGEGIGKEVGSGLWKLVAEIASEVLHAIS